MRYYARSKNYQSPGGPPTSGQPVSGNNNNSGANNANTFGASANKPAPRGQAATQQPPISQMGAAGGGMAGAGSRRPAPPTPGYAARGAASSAPPPNNMGHSPPPSAMREQPSMGGQGAVAPQMGSGGPTLFLIYNGQRYPVTKDQFIIGRGSKTSDLPIKDGNISRKHAAVIRRNGTFYIKDLGSTNGIDYKGMRIDNKRIDEGDVFHLCDYELRFTYRADG
jgi:hypothetical protein